MLVGVWWCVVHGVVLSLWKVPSLRLLGFLSQLCILLFLFPLSFFFFLFFVFSFRFFFFSGVQNLILLALIALRFPCKVLLKIIF